MDNRIHPLHQVCSEAGCNSLSSRYVGPLLGNGELTLFLDENGAMHDFPAFPGWPSPRIYWAGRRRTGQNRPMAPFGFFSANASWEWMESTRWSQALDVQQGVVTTEHERGEALDRTETVMLLDRNLIALHKHVRRLRGAAGLTMRFCLCPPEGLHLPPDLTITDSGTDDRCAWLSYQLDGVVSYQGRVALWADRPCEAASDGNVLTLRASLNAEADDVTFYLALTDDLGDEMFYGRTGWSGRHADHPMLAGIVRDLHDRQVAKDDPNQMIASWREWTDDAGWEGVRAHQASCWSEYWSPGWISLPDAPDVQAIWETGMYALRTQLTRWSIPVAIHGDYFNGQYFPDEMAGVKALLLAGHWPLVQRCAEHKLSVVPLGMQLLDGTGARGDAANFEGGYFYMSAAGSSVYEVHATGEPPRLIWSWAQYADPPREALERYYPVFWGAAEFFRRWMVYKGADGRYFTGACVDANESVPAVINGAATVAGAIGSMNLAAQVAQMLGRDEALASCWREIAAGLAANVPTNRRGLLAPHNDEEGVSFVPIRMVRTPFSNGLIDPKDPRVHRTLEAFLAECKIRENWAVAASADAELAAHSQDVGNPHPVAWTWPPAEIVGVLAAMRNGNRAAEVVEELIRCSDNFGSLYECKVMTDGYVSLPWFVTSSTELTASISAMLIQSEEDRIDLLPAIPDHWQNLQIKLAATHRTTVCVTVRDGTLAELCLEGPVSPRLVRIPRRFEPGSLLGDPVAEDDDMQEFRVAAYAGINKE